MPSYRFSADATPDWVSRLANEHGLGLVPWSRLVGQALQLALDATHARQAAYAIADEGSEHLLVWPSREFISLKGVSDLTAEAATARGGFLYGPRELPLCFGGHPWVSAQTGITWCAGRALPGAAGSRLGSVVVFGGGAAPAAPAVQDSLRAAVGLLASALIGQPPGDSGPALMNRRDFDRQLSRETRRSERSGQPLGILLASLACRNRRQAASETEVQHLGEAIARLLRRGGDYTARYGSHSVAILLPDSDAAATAGTAGMLNAALAPRLAEFNSLRTAPLSLKLVSTSVRGYALAEGAAIAAGAEVTA